MRRTHRAGLIALLSLPIVFAACGRVADRETAVLKTPAVERAARRAFDGAPPTMPHDEFGMTCTECHQREGRQVEGVGFSPPSPHELTAGMSAISRCRQCHVQRKTDEEWRSSTFAGQPQDLRRGGRAHDLAPPVMPHPSFMRENCLACHSGAAAREEIRTSHPERARCEQCHVERRTELSFAARAGV